jgi:hypothetical protein
MINQMDMGGNQAVFLNSETFVNTVWVVEKPKLRTMIDFFNTGSYHDNKNINFTIRNCEGIICNEAQLIVEPNGIASLDLTVLIGGCSIDSGIRHSPVEITAPLTLPYCIRLVSRDNFSRSVKGLFNVTKTAPFFSFLPTISASTVYLGLINLGNEPAEAQCRIYFDKHYREIIKFIPQLGCSIFRVEDDFREVLETEKDVPKYIRIAQRSEKSNIAVQLLEEMIDELGNSTFTSVS